MVHSTFYDWIPTFILGYLIVSIQVDFKYKLCNSHEDVLNQCCKKFAMLLVYEIF